MKEEGTEDGTSAAVVMEVGGVTRVLDGHSIFIGCVREIDSIIGLLALKSVIGAENLKKN